MSNALNQDVTNRWVVLDSKIYNDPLCIFFCESGFGCVPFTYGGRIWGKWLSDNQNDNIRGEAIIRFATDEEVKTKTLSG